MKRSETHLPGFEMGTPVRPCVSAPRSWGEGLGGGDSGGTGEAMEMEF